MSRRTSSSSFWSNCVEEEDLLSVSRRKIKTKTTISDPPKLSTRRIILSPRD